MVKLRRSISHESDIARAAVGCPVQVRGGAGAGRLKVSVFDHWWVEWRGFGLKTRFFTRLCRFLAVLAGIEMIPMRIEVISIQIKIISIRVERTFIRVGATFIRVGGIFSRVGATSIRVGGALSRVRAVPSRVGGTFIRMGAAFIRVGGAPLRQEINGIGLSGRESAVAAYCGAAAVLTSSAGEAFWPQPKSFLALITSKICGGMSCASDSSPEWILARTSPE